MRKLALLLFILASSISTGATTRTAASCSISDIQTQINLSSNGDTVVVPACVAGVTWSTSPGLTIGVGITLQGAGIGQTVINDQVPGGVAAIAASLSPSMSCSPASFRLTGFDIRSNGASTISSAVTVSGGSKCFRMDHNAFSGFVSSQIAGNPYVLQFNDTFGVVDHNTVNDGFIVWALVANCGYVNATTLTGGGLYGDASWTAPTLFGTSDALYFENNTITLTGDYQNQIGSDGCGPRYVARFNTFTQGTVGGHGTESPGRFRGMRKLEVYNNLFQKDANVHTGPIDSVDIVRGGTNLFFGNTMTSINGSVQPVNSGAKLATFRVYTSNAPWGWCDGTGPYDSNDGPPTVYATGTFTTATAGSITDTTKTWTTNQWTQNGAPYSLNDITHAWSEEITGNGTNSLAFQWLNNSNPYTIAPGDSYRITRSFVCIDQPGRGQSPTLLSGTTPTPTGWVNDALEPIYAWSNTITNPSGALPITSTTNKTITLRDYYTDSDGTNGVRVGTLAARPSCSSGCTAGMGYWATDQGNWNSSGSGGQGELFVWNGSAWSLYYTPYCYPHPLVAGSACGGAGTPSVSLSPTSIAFGSVLVGSTSPSSTVTVKNTGTANLVFTGGNAGISISGTNPSDFAQTNNCNQAVAPGGSCSIVVTCTPASAASFSANVSVSDNAAGSPQTVGLTCTGVTAAPAITFTPTQIAFASQNVGTSSTPTPITVTNNGTAALNISQVIVSGGNSTSFTQTNNCTLALQPLDQCTVFVTFTPTVAGNLTSCICFTDNAPGSPQSVVVTGTGLGTTGIVFSPTSLAFGNQTVSSTSSALSVTVSNSGSAPISLTSVAITGTNAADYAISANTCGSTIAVGGSCVVQAKFTPSAPGSRMASLSFSDNAPASPQLVAMTGTGTQAGTGFSPSNLAFGNQNLSTTSAPQTTTLTNTGSSTLNITSITITGTNASDFAISTKTCGTTLAPAGTCTVSVTFTPALAGARSASLSFADNAPSSPQTVPLTGTGLSTSLTVVPSSLTFPATVVGQASASQTITVTNSGTTSITFTSILVSTGNAADFSQTNNCPASVAPQTNCTATVTFKPVATGARASAVVLTDSAPTSPQSVALTGTGTQSGALPSPTSVAFANQPVGTTSGASNVTLTNNGTATLNISGITLGGTDPSYFAISANTCGATLTASSSCTVSLTFTPQTAITATGTLSFADDGPGAPQVVNLSGTGTTTAISFTPASLTFPTQNVSTTSAPLTFNILNTGNGTITISGITIVGTNFGDFVQTNNCGSSLGPSSSCTVSVKFTPSSAGTRVASVSVADNAPNSPQTVALQGVGQTQAPVVCLSQTTLVFGNQTVGTTSNPQVVIVSNTGSASLTISSATITGANPGDFGENTTCSGTLAPNASCTYSFVFTPTAAGTRGATFNLATNAPSSPNTVTLSGTGVSSPTVQPGPAPQVFGDD